MTKSGKDFEGLLRHCGYSNNYVFDPEIASHMDLGSLGFQECPSSIEIFEDM